MSNGLCNRCLSPTGEHRNGVWICANCGQAGVCSAACGHEPPQGDTGREPWRCDRCGYWQVTAECECKLFRIATDRDALGESPWRDIAGYALLSVARAGRQVAEGRATPLERRAGRCGYLAPLGEHSPFCYLDAGHGGLCESSFFPGGGDSLVQWWGANPNPNPPREER